MCVCKNRYVYTYIDMLYVTHVYKYICIDVCACCIYAYMHMHTYVCIDIHVCMYRHICAYMHVIYTYIYISIDRETST